MLGVLSAKFHSTVTNDVPTSPSTRHKRITRTDSLQDTQKGQTSHQPPTSQDAPFRGHGRSERPKIVVPSLLVYFILRVARMSPPLRASNEGPSQAGRCTRTGDSPSHPSPCWRAYKHPASSDQLASTEPTSAAGIIRETARLSRRYRADVQGPLSKWDIPPCRHSSTKQSL